MERKVLIGPAEDRVVLFHGRLNRLNLVASPVPVFLGKWRSLPRSVGKKMAPSTRSHFGT